MMGNVVTDIFERVYVMMKLSLMFWSMTFLGGVILGIGPAFLMITDLYNEHQWAYQDMEWMDMLKMFKKYFKRGNILFYFFLAFFSFAAYNLYLAVQVQGILFLVIDFFLVVLLAMLVVSFIYSLVLNAEFEISLKNLIKLSVVSLFANFMAIFRAVILLVVMGMITNRYKGLILFITPGLFAITMTWLFKDWKNIVHEKME